MHRVCSIFAQLLRPVSRTDFEQAGPERQAGWHARGFTCWGHGTVRSDAVCQLGQTKSLREICGGWPVVKGSCGIQEPGCSISRLSIAIGIAG